MNTSGPEAPPTRPHRNHIVSPPRSGSGNEIHSAAGSSREEFHTWRQTRVKKRVQTFTWLRLGPRAEHVPGKKDGPG
ncbi:hypothetical protein EYF80_060213 [Liparis tanakae]|uniref:Uncharacterized protein n=1 Tax=Liparis tanakae TaxID=230148 RepID=A0A4Z2ELL8_9TELE|nr:hypothetical protein EYF80_060213 [Liparis tanakae]